MAVVKITSRFRNQLQLLVASALLATPSALAVDLANINVTLNAGNPLNPPTVVIAQGTVANGGLGTEGFFIDAGTVLGEIPIRIGAAASNDAAGGVLLGYVRENGRSVLDGGGSPETIYTTSSTVRDVDVRSNSTRDLNGGLSLVVDRAGGTGVGSGNTLFPLGGPAGANLAAAYFPFSQGWVGGTAYNELDGGSFTSLVGSPGLTLGTNLVQDAFTASRHRVVIPGVVDSRRQGLLFVNGATNENNYAMSEPADDGDGWVLTLHDNNVTSANGELDPVSFLFLPLGTSNVTMARIHPSSGQDLQPTAMLKSGSNFTITRESPVDLAATPYTTGGSYRLSIPGQSPTSGVLLVSPSGQGRSAGGANTNNIVSYQADGNDWIITSQDLRDLNPLGEFSRERISYFNFAFIPFNSPPTAPAAIPAPNFTKNRVIGWNTNITHESSGGGTGETFATVTQHTAGVPVQGLSENGGDYGFSVDGDFLVASDGVMWTSIREGLRDNTGTGGFFEYGIALSGFFVPEWIAFMDGASPSTGEHEINISNAFFGADSGFTMASNVTVPAGGKLSLSLPGVTDSRTEGVLMVQAWDNEDNFALATPSANGSGWDVELHDDSTSFESDEINYVYLPYASQNLVAGWVDEDGSLKSSTNSAGFTLVREAAGSYLLTIPGKSPETGMLMLTGTGETGSMDNVLAYETAGSSFRIFGLDMITVADETGGELVDLEDTEFSFAYIDFNNGPIAPGSGPDGDFDGDQDVDGADFLAWQRDYDTLSFADWKAGFGTTPAEAAGAGVPEPGTCVGAVIGAVVLLTRRRNPRGRW